MVSEKDTEQLDEKVLEVLDLATDLRIKGAKIESDKEIDLMYPKKVKNQNKNSSF